MRTSQRIATVCFISAALAALVSACGSSDNTTTPPPATAGTGSGTAGAASGTAGAASGTAGGSGTLTGVPANGASLYGMVNPGCSLCHGPNAEGGLGPNITGDATAGIGAWTQTQFYDAVRSAKNRKGAALCMQMAPFSTSQLSDQSIADLYAYLKTLDNTTVNTGTYCMSSTSCFNGPCTGSAM